jgi:NADH-dependent peroxiredoxin subunit F
MIYDLAIIGGGPAGVAAGVYAARKQLKTIFVTESFGGQSVESMGVENWIGTINIPGQEFAKILEAHLRAYAGDVVEIKVAEKVESIESVKGSDNSTQKFLIKTAKNLFESSAILITTGSKRRKLEVPGATEFENKGISYCASCDGPIFADQDVAIIGGGNAAFETAAQLLAYSKSVVLLNRSNEFKADPITVNKVLSNPKMKATKGATLKEIKGDKFVSSLVYDENGVEKEISVSGIFAEIGLIPSTDIVKNLVKLNEYNQIVVDSKNQRTSLAGIWAAGDSTDGLYHQNNIAAGDAVKALEDIYLYLRTQ